MAHIKNLDGTLKVQLSFIKNSMLDYNPTRENYENWIPFTLSLSLQTRQSVIGESAKATMTVLEVQNFIEILEKVLDNFNKQLPFISSFCTSESFFELNFEVLPEDSAIEIELWINVGSQTSGKVYGYDEGIRFISSDNELAFFTSELKQNFFDIISII